MPKPKVIFLDAVGTLFGIKGSVGQVYSEQAQSFGVSVSPELLDRAFFKSFQALPPAVFPGTSPQELPNCEFEWWRVLVRGAFEQVGVLHQFSDFSTFFAELYNYFATATPWFVYADVRPALTRWRQQKIELGVVSNFDSRLYSVLQALELEQFFSSITIATQAGVAKPDPQIFTIGLQKHHFCPPEAAWHIGDSLQEDCAGAKAAGLKPILIKRP